MSMPPWGMLQFLVSERAAQCPHRRSVDAGQIGAHPDCPADLAEVRALLGFAKGRQRPWRDA